MMRNGKRRMTCFSIPSPKRRSWSLVHEEQCLLQTTIPRAFEKSREIIVFSSIRLYESLDVVDQMNTPYF